MFCCEGSWCYGMKRCGNELPTLLAIGFTGQALFRKIRWIIRLGLGIDEIVRSRGFAFVVIPAKAGHVVPLFKRPRATVSAIQ